MSARTLVLGGGFGGIATAVELRRLLGDDHEIVLVDRKPQFTMGLRKLWELVGHGTIADGSRSRALLARHGVEFLQTEISGDRRLGTPGGDSGRLARRRPSRGRARRGVAARPRARARGARARRVGLRRRAGRSRGAERLRRRADRRPHRRRSLPVPAGAVRVRPPSPRAPSRPWLAGPDGARGCDAPADAAAERRSRRLGLDGATAQPSAASPTGSARRPSAWSPASSCSPTARCPSTC